MNKTLPIMLAMSLLTLPIESAHSQNTIGNTQPQVSIETKADEAHNFNEYKAVKAALKPYIDAAKSGDGKLSRSAFYDHANIVGSIGGQYKEPDADAFGKLIDAGGKSPDVQHQIAWIDISGPAAAAKVEFFNWRGFRFTDFFVLYKKDGEWKISSKVYDSHSNN